MALTIEDGTAKTNADSFATVAEAQAFATARNLTLPETDAEIEKLLVKAADFLIGLEPHFQGFRVGLNQRLPFPRFNVIQNGYYVDSDAIPETLKEAQIRLAISANTTELRPDGTGQEITREKIGPIETEYGKTGSGTVNPQFNQAMDFLKPLMKNAGGWLNVQRA